MGTFIWGKESFVNEARWSPLINAYNGKSSYLNTAAVADNAMKSRNLIKDRHNFSLDGTVNNVLDCVFALSLFTTVSPPRHLDENVTDLFILRLYTSPPHPSSCPRVLLFASLISYATAHPSILPIVPRVIRFNGLIDWDGTPSNYVLLFAAFFQFSSRFLPTITVIDIFNNWLIKGFIDFTRKNKFLRDINEFLYIADRQFQVFIEIT